MVDCGKGIINNHDYGPKTGEFDHFDTAIEDWRSDFTMAIRHITGTRLITSESVFESQMVITGVLNMCMNIMRNDLSIAISESKARKEDPEFVSASSGGSTNNPKLNRWINVPYKNHT